MLSRHKDVKRLKTARRGCQPPVRAPRVPPCVHCTFCQTNHCEYCVRFTFSAPKNPWRVRFWSGPRGGEQVARPSFHAFDSPNPVCSPALFRHHVSRLPNDFAALNLVHQHRSMQDQFDKMSSWGAVCVVRRVKPIGSTKL